MDSTRDSDDEQERNATGTNLTAPNIQAISGRTFNNPVLGGIQYKTINSNVYQTFQHHSLRPVEEGTFNLNPNIVVYENKPINKESRIYRGKILSDLLGNIDVVLKFDKLDERSRREANLIMRIPHHQNIVKHLLADTFYYRGQPSIYIVLEKCEINMHDYVKSQLHSKVVYDADKYLSYGYQIVTGVSFLHDHNIVDRDLKPSNILLAENATLVKICDFGMSKQITPGQNIAATSTMRPGTDGWRAPEILNHKPHPPFAPDIYSLALNLFFLWKLGSHPFGNDPDSWNYFIKHGINLDLSGMMVHNSKTATVLLTSMLDRDPTKRPKVKEVSMHEVFGSHGHGLSRRSNNVNKEEATHIQHHATTRPKEIASHEPVNVPKHEVTPFKTKTSKYKGSATIPFYKNISKIILLGGYDSNKTELKESCLKLVSRVLNVEESERNKYEDEGKVIEWTGDYYSPTQKDVEKLQQELLTIQQSNDGITCIIFAYGHGTKIVNSALNKLDAFLRKRESPDNLRETIQSNLAVFTFNAWQYITQDKAKIVDNIKLTDDTAPDTGKIELEEDRNGRIRKEVWFHDMIGERSYSILERIFKTLSIKDFVRNECIIRYILTTLEQVGQLLDDSKQGS